MELRDVWIGKARQPNSSQQDASDALVQVQEAEGAEPSAAAAAESKQKKEIRELQAYLKQLNAKTNLLDLASEVFADKKLLQYGWMSLGFKHFMKLDFVNPFCEGKI